MTQHTRYNYPEPVTADGLTFEFQAKIIQNTRPCDFCGAEVQRYYLSTPLHNVYKLHAFIGLKNDVIGRVCFPCMDYIKEHGYIQFKFAYHLGLLEKR